MKTMNMILLAGVTMLMLSSCDNGHRTINDVKNCPDWTSDSVSNYTNEDFSNMGCATRSNNFTQLQNKEDYYHGVGKSGISVTRDGNILQNYFSGSSGAASSAAPSASASSSSSR